jgi:hypothetical protein
LCGGGSGRDKVNALLQSVSLTNLAPRDRLRRAASTAWSLNADHRHWPAELQGRWQQINVQLFLGGPVDRRVEVLSDEQVQRVLRDLHEFAQAFLTQGPDPISSS